MIDGFISATQLELMDWDENLTDCKSYNVSWIKWKQVSVDLHYFVSGQIFCCGHDDHDYLDFFLDLWGPFKAY